MERLLTHPILVIRVRPKIHQTNRLDASRPHFVELTDPGRLGFEVAVELSQAPAPRGDVGLPLAFLFVAEFEGELDFGSLVLAELRFDALALALQGGAELSRLALATIAQRLPAALRATNSARSSSCGSRSAMSWAAVSSRRR